jgi:putative ABC transport system substrate-binding protein
MDRRVFIGTAAVGALVLSSRANSQRAEKLPQVALVFNNVPVAGMAAHPIDRAFVDGLRNLGLVEGRNIKIERRSADGRYERLPGLMQELLALHVDVIVTAGPGVGAARRATDTIPIVAVAADGLDEGGGCKPRTPGSELHWAHQ